MYRSERTPDGYYVGADGVWDGKPAEAGTHDELMAQGGLYRSIYDKQQLEKQLQEDHPDLPEVETAGGETV